MKRILIYNTAAETGGAKTVLDKCYNDCSKDTENQYYFVVGNLIYPETENIHMLSLGWTKKSWLHRLYCDFFYAQKLIRKLKISEVLSLQNIGLPFCKAFQTVYVQNAIPFTEYRFSFQKERYLWVYQNLIGGMTVHSLKHVDKILVQTQWMKNAVAHKTGVSPERIDIRRIQTKQPQAINRFQPEKFRFFYPTSLQSFKNIDLILDACAILKEQGVQDYEVVLTINGTENSYAESLAERIQEEKLPVKLVGYLNGQQMTEYYQSSALLFPSYVETVGLPLLEAKTYGCQILAADCAYARDAVGEYHDVNYFDFRKADQLSQQMLKILQDGKL